MRGAELEATSRKYAVTAADEEKKTLKSAVTGLVMDNELLKERIRQLEDEKPFLRWKSNR